MFVFRSVVRPRFWQEQAFLPCSYVSTRALFKKTDLKSWAHQWITAGSRTQGKKKTRGRKQRSVGRKKAPLFPCADSQRAKWSPRTKWLLTQTLSNGTEQLQTYKELHTYLRQFTLIYSVQSAYNRRDIYLKQLPKPTFLFHHFINVLLLS